MILYYQTNGDVIAVVLDNEALLFDPSDLGHSGELVIDEITENHNVIRELYRTRYQTDVAGLHRYEVQGGELFERDDWTVEMLIEQLP